MRLLHTMLRVGDLDRSIAFYTELLGMKLLRRDDYPDGKFTLAFVGYEDERDGTVLELTHNWDTPSTTSAPVSATSPSKWTTPTPHVTESRHKAARWCAKPAR